MQMICCPRRKKLYYAYNLQSEKTVVFYVKKKKAVAGAPICEADFKWRDDLSGVAKRRVTIPVKDPERKKT